MSARRGVIRLTLAVIVIGVAAFGWLAWGHDLIGRSLAALVVTVLLPGALLGRTLLAGDDDLDTPERLALSLGLGIATLVLGTLALHMVPGPLSRRLYLGGYAALDLLLLVLALTRPPAMGRSWSSAWSPRQMLALLALLLVAAALRFTWLGYSEFQGDEGRAMLRAAEVLQGNDEVLLLHKKGPVEILVPAALYAAVGRINELTARLPFALANLGAVLALALVARRLFGARVALIAAAVMAVDGFWVGFARIVQYQSVVLLMTLLATLCAIRIWQGTRRRAIYLLVAAALMSVGLLAHYEGVFALVPVAVFVIATWVRERVTWRVWALQLLPPLALGAVLVGSFYIPFVLHPAFSATAVYLGESRVGGALLYNNIADFFQRVGFYNPALYPLALGAVLLVGAAVWAWRACAGRGVARRGIARRILTVLLLMAGLTVVAFPSLWQIGTVNLSALVFIAWMILLWSAPGSTPLKALLAWFGVTALFYFFLMLKVHTHYYVTFAPWAMLAALVLAAGWGALRGRWLRRGALALGLVALGLSGNYVRLAMVDHAVEFKHAYPQSRPAIYWTPFGAAMPRGGYFGFPYRTAWKAIGGMYADGTLKGSYDSNQEDLVTNWYTRGAMRGPDGNLFIIARNAEDPHAIIPEVIEGQFGPAIEVTRDGVPQIWVFRRDYAGPLRRVRYEDYATHFDLALSAPVFRVGAPLDEVFAPSQRVDARLGANFQLVGYDLSAIHAAPGDELILTLYWKTLEPTTTGYHVFAHLGDGELAAQADGAPRGGQYPTYRWQAGEQVVDRHILTVADTGQEGVLPLRVGLYAYPGGQRLRITDPGGQDFGSSLLLAHVRVGLPVFEAPTPATPVDVTLGEGIRLLGYDLATPVIAPDVPARLTLYWLCTAPMTRNYTVFAHLIGPDGLPFGQTDTMPRGGALPTRFWVQGEIITDTIAINVREDAPAGDYRITLGMYDASNLVRLAALQAGQALPDDQFAIGGLTVAAHE